MSKTPCFGCGILMPIRKDKRSPYCRSCSVQHRRCHDCGQLKGQDHTCASVEAKGERRCSTCDRILRNTGWERYSQKCGACSKREFRAKERDERHRLRLQFGGKCEKCGYCKCFAALHFHHRDGTGEKYDWNAKGKSGASLREIRAHPERFQLLCANCHIETHLADGLEPNPGLLDSEVTSSSLEAILPRSQT